MHRQPGKVWLFSEAAGKNGFLPIVLVMIDDSPTVASESACGSIRNGLVMVWQNTNISIFFHKKINYMTKQVLPAWPSKWLHRRKQRAQRDQQMPCCLWQNVCGWISVAQCFRHVGGRRRSIDMIKINTNWMDWRNVLCEDSAMFATCMEIVRSKSR